MVDVSSEIAKFDALADDWWQNDGAMAMLHAMHPARMEFIIEQWQHHQTVGMAGMRALDVGCGGGLTSESLSRLGMKVTGIDAAVGLLSAAASHAHQEGLTIDYRQEDVMNLTEDIGQFDLVCALEVIEHIVHPAEFIQRLLRLLKPNGLLVISTINRTLKSRLLGIVAAEYLLRLLPVGTHDWHKFVTPAEIAKAAQNNGSAEGKVVGLQGMLPDASLKNWRLVPHRVGVNYIMAITLSQ